MVSAHRLTDDGVTACKFVQRPTDVCLERVAVAAAETSRVGHGASPSQRAQRVRVVAQRTRREISTALVLLLVLVTPRNLVNGCNHLQSRLQYIQADVHLYRAQWSNARLESETPAVAGWQKGTR